MAFQLDAGDVYLTNYIPWNAKYRYEFPNYVGLLAGKYIYPIPFSEFEKIRCGNKSLFTIMTYPEVNADYCNYEIIKTHSSLINQDLLIQEYRQYQYHNYHPTRDVLIIWATDDPNCDRLPEPENEDTDLSEDESEIKPTTSNQEELSFSRDNDDE